VQKCTNCGGNHPADSKLCSKYVQIKHILAVADPDKLSYKDAVKKVAITSKKLIKTVQIARETTNNGSSITSARLLVAGTAAETAVTNALCPILEAKLKQVLSQIGTLSSKIDAKIIAVKEEQLKLTESINQKFTKIDL